MLQSGRANFNTEALPKICIHEPPLREETYYPGALMVAGDVF